MTPPKIRAATRVDIPAVLDLLRLSHREFPPMGDMDEESILQTINNCLDNGAILISESKDGLPVASLGILASKFWWTKDKYYLGDYWMFVHPGHRRVAHARTLLETAKIVSDSSGLPFLPGIFSTVRTAGKIRLYKQIFGEPAGAVFMWRPN